MAPSISPRSIIIHFSSTNENEEQQPFATPPKENYRSTVIQAPELKFQKVLKQKEDKEQPVFLQATTPPQISTSCFIQTPQLQFPMGTVLTSLVPLAILILFLFIAMKLTCLCPF
ncbi:hypothetical protein NC651_038403 [Populus alba x Populus x berolinensis]|nr:hypothetical protein NC651_038403 [Populus alba x Populus x berolinensis]